MFSTGDYPFEFLERYSHLWHVMNVSVWITAMISNEKQILLSRLVPCSAIFIMLILLLSLNCFVQTVTVFVDVTGNGWKTKLLMKFESRAVRLFEAL
jgi:hypothetical protein